MTARRGIDGQGAAAPDPAGGDPAGGGIVTRFAPSPTGRLHLGHAWSAIAAHDFAMARGGRFLLRIEDIDGTRSRPEHVRGILDDLAWLGLAYDGPVFQSERLALYAHALERLKAMELVYPCFCTRAEIAASLSAPHGPAGPVYPGTCRVLPEAERDARMAEPHCWRLDMAKALASVGIHPGEGRGPVGKVQVMECSVRQLPSSQLDPGLRRGGRIMPDLTLAWHDAAAGWIAADPLPQGDVVLARKDAPASYHLAVTIDDAAQGVTDIVRGADLFEATHVHRLLQALLGLPTPRYRHHALLTDANGERLAKRTGAPSLVALREGGADGLALAETLRARIAERGETTTLTA